MINIGGVILVLRQTQTQSPWFLYLNIDFVNFEMSLYSVKVTGKDIFADKNEIEPIWKTQRCWFIYCYF